MKILLSTRNIQEWLLWIHDRYHYVIDDSRVYGSDILDICVDTIEQWGYPNHFQYAVFPTKTIFINKENDHCLSEKEIAENPIQQCLQEHLDYKLNCTLPWRLQKATRNLPLCSHPLEYDQYRESYILKSSDSNYFKNEAKCSPGCTRYDFSTKLYKRELVEEMILAGRIKVIQKKILSEYGTKIKNTRDLQEFATAKEIMDTTIDGN